MLLSRKLISANSKFVAIRALVNDECEDGGKTLERNTICRLFHFGCSDTCKVPGASDCSDSPLHRAVQL